jgi:hypothetical protein
LTKIEVSSIQRSSAMALKEVLERLGLKQTEFARLVQVSPRTVSLWATGESPMPGPVLAYLRVLVALSPEALAVELNRLDGRTQMLEEGIYNIAYRGELGHGSGTLVFRNGKVAGTDVSGGSFEGTYNYDAATQLNNVVVTLKVPPNGSLVTGLTAGPMGATLPISASFKRPAPKSAARVKVAGRPVDVELTFVRSLPH